jgi:hypothetical protein
MDLFPSTGEESGTATLLDPLERTNAIQWTSYSNGTNIVGVYLISPEDRKRSRMVSSGMLHRVALVKSDVSDELTNWYFFAVCVSC